MCPVVRPFVLRRLDGERFQHAALERKQFLGAANDVEEEHALVLERGVAVEHQLERRGRGGKPVQEGGRRVHIAVERLLEGHVRLDRRRRAEADVELELRRAHEVLDVIGQERGEPDQHPPTILGRRRVSRSSRARQTRLPVRPLPAQ